MACTASDYIDFAELTILSLKPRTLSLSTLWICSAQHFTVFLICDPRYVAFREGAGKEIVVRYLRLCAMDILH